MDFRKSLRIPDRFAYVLRTGGGNPRGVEFEISYAIAVGGARSLALVAHDDCAMVGLHRRRDIYIQGLVLEGWSRDEAIAHFDSQSQARDLSNPGSFVRDEARRLQTRYPNITVAPLFYSVEDGMLYQL
jgi:carbonic anhydrase